MCYKFYLFLSTDPPVITVKPLNVTVNESTDTNVTSVFLQCVYFANPQELKGALW